LGTSLKNKCNAKGHLSTYNSVDEVSSVPRPGRLPSPVQPSALGTDARLGLADCALMDGVEQVWTFVLKNPTFSKLENSGESIGPTGRKCKIVACKAGNVDAK